MGDIATRNKLMALQDIFEHSPNKLTAADFPTKHHFSNGVYAREIFIAAGRALIGKVHKHSHLFTLVGDCLIVVEGVQTRYTGQYTGESPAGTQRAIYAVQDTILTTIHVTQETDLNKIEQEVIAPNHTSLEDNT